jgi:peptidoglycan/LPS O-acetylase OafA/YrhL
MSTPRIQLPALTGIRFIAALFVVVFHSTSWEHGNWPALARNLALSAVTAVEMFFVLSGFVLTYTYRGEGTLREYYAGRAARIYPVYLLALLLSLPFFVWSHVRRGAYGALILEGGAVLALVQSYVPSLAMAWNPPAWSLSAEATFYLLFPFIVRLLLRARLRIALGVAVFASVVAIALPTLYVVVAPDGDAVPTVESNGFWLNILKYNPLVRVCDFIVGIALGRAFLDEAWRASVARHAPWLSLVAAAGIGATASVSSVVPFPLLHNGLLVPLFAVLVVTLATREGPLARWLGTPLLVLLGEASYALYILHVPLLILAHHGAAALFGAPFLRTGWFTVMFMVSAVLASVVSFRAVEVPMRTWLRGVLNDRAASRTAVASSREAPIRGVES